MLWVIENVKLPADEWTIVACRQFIVQQTNASGSRGMPIYAI